MKGDRLNAKVLASRVISNVSDDLVKALHLRPEQRSIAVLTGDSDDVMYTALDEATKKAAVEVVYAKSFYAGAANATNRLSGEVIGILAAPNPEEVRSGLDAAVYTIEHGAAFISANEDDSISYFAHCVSRTGSYLSNIAGIPKGEALAYLIAPPLEAIVGVDEALKASDVTMCEFFSPPSETNYGGALLTGTQSACKAACEAFAAAIERIADRPKEA